MAFVEFVGARYAAGGRAILDGFDLSVEAGETLVLLGRSGSGKTTALKLINGLLQPAAGEVRVDGRATSAWDPIRLKRSIGYVIQEAGLFPHFSVEENVGLVPRLEGWEANRIRERVEFLLTQVGLDPAVYRHRKPRQLSGGERQRVGVARALAADPPLLLFDEPFGALDPVTRFELQRQFLALRRDLGKTAVFVTHDVREALRLGSRIALLREGRLEIVASPEAFRAAKSAEARAFTASIEDGV